ncbi:hypothetical protein EBZ39_04295, partial [bacterium]|nr:hypothetical protein [bacterium]
NIYDDIVNAAPSKFDATVQGYFAEIIENFEKMSDIVADHRAMCAKVQEELNKREESEDDTEEHEASPRRRSDMTR